MGTQAGHASRKKGVVQADPLFSDKHVSNDVAKCIEIGYQNVLADKTVVPTKLLACSRLNVVHSPCKNCIDIGGAIVL